MSTKKRTPITGFRINLEVVEEFKCIARKRGLNYQDAVEQAIIDWMNRTDILEKNPE